MSQPLLNIQKLRRLTFRGILLLFLLIALLIGLLQTSFIQTRLAQYASRKIAEKLDTEVSVKRSTISLLRGIVINDLLIKDQQKDTLLHSNELSVTPDGFFINSEGLSFHKVSISGLYVNLYANQDSVLNLRFLIEKLSGGSKNQGNGLNFSIQEVDLKNAVFAYKIPDTIQRKGWNWKDFKLSDISLKINDLQMKDETLSASIRQLSFRDKSEFKLTGLQCDTIRVSPKNIALKKLLLATPNSQLAFDTVGLKYPENYDFSQLEKLNTYVHINPFSRLSFRDLGYFIGDVLPCQTTVFLSGIFSGHTDKISASGLRLQAGNFFRLSGNFHLQKAYTSSNPYFRVQIKKLSADIDSLKLLTLNGNSLLPFDKLPQELKFINKLIYAGTSEGTLSDFKSEGEITGNFGSLQMELLGAYKNKKNFHLTGKFTGIDLDVGKALNIKNLQTATFTHHVDFNYIDKPELRMQGTFNSLIFKKYNYKDIHLRAHLDKNQLDSFVLSINNRRVQASINGQVNFAPQAPEINVAVNLQKIDFHALNLDKKHPKSIASGAIVANFKGISIDDIEGKLQLTQPFCYYQNKDSLYIKKLSLTAQNKQNRDVPVKIITLDSDPATIELSITDSASVLLNSLKSLTNQIINPDSSLQTFSYPDSIPGSLKINANLKKTEALTRIFLPDLKIKNNIQIYTHYKPQNEILNFSVNSEDVKYKDMIIKELYLVGYTKNKRLLVGIGGSSFTPYPPFILKNFNLEGSLKNDSVNFSLSWNNHQDIFNNMAHINGSLLMQKDSAGRSFDIRLDDSKIVINDTVWQTNKASCFVQNDKIYITNLRLASQSQSIYIDGNISKYPGDILFVNFQKLNIAMLNPLLSPETKLQGRLHGSIRLAQLYDHPLIFAQDSITGLKINKLSPGDFYFNSSWDDNLKRIKINAYNLQGKKRFMNDSIYGEYYPTKDSINFAVNIRSLPLKTFESFYKGYVDFNRTAYIKGKLNIHGSSKKLHYDGLLRLKQTSVKIEYTQTINNLDELILDINENQINIRPTKMVSPYKSGQAIISGKIRHNKFKNFYLDAQIDAQNYPVTDIKQSDSADFYGKSFVTGKINFTGPFHSILLSSDIKTNAGTRLYIPIATSESVNEEANFIRFKKEKNDKIPVNQKKKNVPKTEHFRGFALDLRIKVLPNAEIQIIPDVGVGDIITTGTGSLRLKQNAQNGFEIFGLYLIEKGQYIFNLQNLVQRNFHIKENSKIEWFGNPEDALVDITAYVRLNNVALKTLNLLQEENGESDVFCNLTMTNTLLSPDLQLGIEFPQNTNRQYAQRLSLLSKDELNQQFLMLLLFKQFLPIRNSIGSSAVAGSSTDAYDLLELQLNNLLQQIGYSELGVIYEAAQDKNYNDKFGLEYTKSLLNDRIELKGNVGTSGGRKIKTSENSSSIVGEVEINAKLNEKGTLQLKAYNKGNNEVDNHGTYTQGVGLMWVKKFNNLGRKKNKSKRKRRRPKAKKHKQELP